MADIIVKGNRLGVNTVRVPKIGGGTQDFEIPSGGGSSFAPDFKLYITGNQNLTMDLTGLETSNMTDMSYIIQGNTGITELNLSAFVTSNAVTMENMLASNSSLRTLRLGVGFITINANVTGMFNMSPINTIYYAGTQSQFNTNCANMIQELARSIGAGNTVTVHCSDGDITIQGQVVALTPSIIGHVNDTNWDTDLEFTDMGNNTWTYTGVQLQTGDFPTLFKIRFGGSWTYVYGYGDQGTAVNFTNGAENLFQDGTTAGYGFVPDSGSDQFTAIADGTVNITITTDGDHTITAMTIEKVTT